MYKTGKTRKLVELNSFLPNLTKVEFKEIYNRSFIGSPRSNYVVTKPNIKHKISPREVKPKKVKNSARQMEKSYQCKNQKKNNTIKLKCINDRYILPAQLVQSATPTSHRQSSKYTDGSRMYLMEQRNNQGEKKHSNESRTAIKLSSHRLPKVETINSKRFV